MNRLKELRQEKGLTQQALADEIGVTKITILRWEKGDRQIKPEKAQQLADYFGVSVGYLLGYDNTGVETIFEYINPNSLLKKEYNTLASLGYPLSDSDIHSIVDLLHTLSSQHKKYFLKLLEYEGDFLESELKENFSFFLEQYPSYLKELTSEFRHKTSDH